MNILRRRARSLELPMSQPQAEVFTFHSGSLMPFRTTLCHPEKNMFQFVTKDCAAFSSELDCAFWTNGTSVPFP